MKWLILEIGIKLVQLNLKLTNDGLMEYVIGRDFSFVQKRNLEKEKKHKKVAKQLIEANKKFYGK